MDPPYGQEYEKSVLTMLGGMRYVTENTLIIIEASLKTDFSGLEETGFCMVRDKQYKTNRHVFIRKI